MAMTVNNTVRLVSTVTGAVAYTLSFSSRDFATAFRRVEKRAIELINTNEVVSIVSGSEDYFLYLATNTHMKVGDAKHKGEVIGIYNHKTGQLEDY